MQVVFVNTFFKHGKNGYHLEIITLGHLILWNFIFAFILLALVKIAIPPEARGNFGVIAGFDNNTSCFLIPTHG